MSKFKAILIFPAIGMVFLLCQAHGKEVENILQNPGFEDGIVNPWTSYGAVQIEVVGKEADPIEGDFCLHVTVLQRGANFWDAGVQYKNLVFEKGEKYTLAVFLKAKKPMNINLKPELAQDPWTGYGERQVTMTEEWQEFHTTTPKMPATVNPAEITFHVAFDVNEFWMDYVRFYEGDYVEPDLETGKPKAVRFADKLTTIWGRVKSSR